MKQQEQTRQRQISGENNSDSDFIPCKGGGREKEGEVVREIELKLRDKLVSLCVCVMGLNNLTILN